MNQDFEFSNEDRATRFVISAIRPILGSAPVRLATGSVSILIKSASALVEPTLLRIEARCEAIRVERNAFDRFLELRNHFEKNASLARCKHYCEIVLRIPDYGAKINTMISTVAQYDCDHDAAVKFMERVYDSVQRNQNLLMEQMNSSAQTRNALLMEGAVSREE
jgi:hypothetical protein